MITHFKWICQKKKTKLNLSFRYTTVLWLMSFTSFNQMTFCLTIELVLMIGVCIQISKWTEFVPTNQLPLLSFLFFWLVPIFSVVLIWTESEHLSYDYIIEIDWNATIANQYSFMLMILNDMSSIYDYIHILIWSRKVSKFQCNKISVRGINYMNSNRKWNTSNRNKEQRQKIKYWHID